MRSNSDFTDKEESDIEDLFEPDLFATIVNNAYELPEGLKLTPKTLDEADKSTGRLVKKAEAVFKVIPEPTPMFDHFTPSAWLIRNPAALDGGKKTVETTLARAEKLFQALNSTLT